MQKGCDELVAKHAKRKEMEERQREIQKGMVANETGNENAKVYINDSKGRQTSGQATLQEMKKDQERELGLESEEDSDDEYLNDAEDLELERIRKKRLAQMKKKQANRTKGFGDYMEIIEGEFLKQVTTYKKVACHFYHDEFVSCKILDKHMKILAHQYPDVKFLKLNVQKSPFMVQKLGIKTLPTIVFFIDGIAKDRMIGFHELGGQQDFRTRFLEMRFMKAGLVIDETPFGTYDDDDELESIFENMASQMT